MSLLRRIAATFARAFVIACGEVAEALDPTFDDDEEQVVVTTMNGHSAGTLRPGGPPR